jgi:integrase
LDFLDHRPANDHKEPGDIGALVSKLTRESLGVDVSPHLFRTAAATTAATYGGSTPRLASALLNHTDPRVTEGYIRPSSVHATNVYGEIIYGYLWD